MYCYLFKVQSVFSLCIVDCFISFFLVSNVCVICSLFTTWVSLYWIWFYYSLMMLFYRQRTMQWNPTEIDSECKERGKIHHKKKWINLYKRKIFSKNGFFDLWNFQNSYTYQIQLFLDMNGDKKNINEKLAKHILSVTFNKTCTKMYKLCQEFKNTCLAINGRQPNVMLCG